MKISLVIPSTKQAREKDEGIVAKNVERLSHPPMEQHIIDYKTQEDPLMKSQK